MSFSQLANSWPSPSIQARAKKAVRGSPFVKPIEKEVKAGSSAYFVNEVPAITGPMPQKTRVPCSWAVPNPQNKPWNHVEVGNNHGILGLPRDLFNPIRMPSWTIQGIFPLMMLILPKAHFWVRHLALPASWDRNLLRIGRRSSFTSRSSWDMTMGD